MTAQATAPGRIDFLKVQGTGNDFVLVDGRSTRADWAALAPGLCDRHFGIGSDGLLVMQESQRAPVRMVMYNPDGSEAEMCGNGLRTFVKYAVERGGVAAPGGRLDVETGAGVLRTSFAGANGAVEQVRIDMGAPILRPAAVPVELGPVTPGPACPDDGPLRDLALRVGEEEITVTCVSLGNPHAVHFTETPVEQFPLSRVGPLVEHDAHFPRRVNFEIVNVLAPDHLRMRVWERGAGETLGCGTGACAALVAARLHGRAESVATVSLPGGDLRIEWAGDAERRSSVFLEGPAEYVFAGSWQPTDRDR